ncbi:hypothetical protein DBT_0582 [Dissulfuribacter thermophilus]|uniref:PilZ domain-containing protein n=1 Tax=Dissulfuribacter thermophilus TaxID=1156395 RepID=A0A1B9F889_9BACT|nr:PilZ domain-containing protein [Dissulfuribacter thermophilus]OCC16120.1 hypothetical protein DBT_0582 [Dissulfuribacter thermophilus]
MLVPIKLRGKVKEILSRSNIQIFNLNAIDKKYRDLLLSGKIPVLIIFENETKKGRIHDLGNGNISVETSEEIPIYIKKGNTVVVVLPVSQNRRYILQGIVTNRYINSVELTILDPRTDKRFNVFDKNISVGVHFLPESIIHGITYETLLILRDINYGMEDQDRLIQENARHRALAMSKDTTIDTNNSISQIKDPKDQDDSNDKSSFTYRAKDFCIDLATRKIHPEFQSLKDSEPSFFGTMYDISKGGLSLLCPDGQEGMDSGTAMLVTAKFPLDDVLWFDFSLLGIVRGITQIDEGKRLHVMFFKALPERTQNLFERMMQ